MKKIIFFLCICLSNYAFTQDVIDNAIQLVNEEKYNEAVRILEEFILREPENPHAYYLLGQAYFKLHCSDGSLIENTDINLALKASINFKKVIELTPEYKGMIFILDPYSKLTSIWGTMAMTYTCKNNMDSAKICLKYGRKEGGFYDALLEYNKNLLATCEKNSILFTNGDNDTFPMLFLQMIENYRTDVTIVNTSLLNTQWYIKQLKNRYPAGNNNVSMNFSNEEIDSLSPCLWSEKKVEINHQDSTMANQKLSWILKPTIEGIGLRIQDLAMFRIIKSNFCQRPIYFSYTLNPDNFLGLNEYLMDEGLAYRLNYDGSGIDAEKIYLNLFENYTFESLRNNSSKYVIDLRGFVQNYRYVFINLAEFWCKNNDRHMTKIIVERMYNKIPEDLIPYPNIEVKSYLLELYNGHCEE